MSIEIKQVNVLENPSFFTSPFKFEITFDCLAPGVKDELEWKLIYVGSADNDSCDQELDSVLVGPVQVGKNRFVFQAPCPDASKIPKRDLLDVTVLLLTCHYQSQEFIRVGYYVSNEYPNYNGDSQMPLPDPIDINKIKRNILANKPRVTRFHINWDNTDNNNNTNNNNNNNNNNNKMDNNNNSNDNDEKSQSNGISNNNNNGNNNNNNNNSDMLDDSMDNFIIDDTNGAMNDNDNDDDEEDDDDNDNDMEMAD